MGDKEDLPNITLDASVACDVDTISGMEELGIDDRESLQRCGEQHVTIEDNKSPN